MWLTLTGKISPACRVTVTEVSESTGLNVTLPAPSALIAFGTIANGAADAVI